MSKTATVCSCVRLQITSNGGPFPNSIQSEIRKLDLISIMNKDHLQIIMCQVPGMI